MTRTKKMPNVSMTKALKAAKAMTITVSLMSITVTPMLFVLTQKVLSLVLAGCKLQL